MHLCFVVEGYPTRTDPFMPFIRELAAEMVKQGVKVSVIAPQSMTRAFFHHLRLRPRKWRDSVGERLTIDIHQPYYATFSGKTPRFNWANMAFAAQRAFNKVQDTVDAFYCHFWHMGVVASQIRSSLPIFVACGESKIEVRDDFNDKQIARLTERLAGVIYVGTKSFEESKMHRLQNGTPYIIAPNGYNAKEFHKKDKDVCRRELGWPKDDFIVLFVGSFNNRKGVDRLSEALNRIDETVYSCFIGSGAIEPNCRRILYKGREEHSRIVDYLNASDVFVLPTNNEGCCNAIVEAIACGVPVISSNQIFNHDIIDGDCSIQIDPMNVESIKNAILTLKHEPALLKKLAAGAEERSKRFDIFNRTQKIIQFINSNIE